MIAREVVFVDIALVQIAALGATAAILVGFEIDSAVSYVFGLGATSVGAVVLSLTHSRERRVSQEAVIGVVYAVSAGAAVLVVDRAPHGAEHLRSMMVGSLLAVRDPEVAKVAALYAVIGVFHCSAGARSFGSRPIQTPPSGMAGVSGSGTSSSTPRSASSSRTRSALPVF